MTQAIKKAYRFPVWGWFFVFFGVVFIMDGIMVFFARETFNGISVDDAYNKGIHYNETLHKAAALKGWNSEIVWDNAGKSIQASFSNSAGEKLTGGRVSAILYRPTHAGFDFKTDLVESAKNSGLYNTTEPLIFPLEGLWEIRLEALKDDKILETKKRITVRP